MAVLNCDGSTVFSRFDHRFCSLSMKPWMSPMQHTTLASWDSDIIVVVGSFLYALVIWFCEAYFFLKELII